jgi:hypothetical protein
MNFLICHNIRQDFVVIGCSIITGTFDSKNKKPRFCIKGTNFELFTKILFFYNFAAQPKLRIFLLKEPLFPWAK